MISISVNRNSIAHTWDGRRFVQVAANQPRYEPVLSHGVAATPGANFTTYAGGYSPRTVDTLNDKLVVTAGDLVYWKDKTGAYTLLFSVGAFWAPTSTGIRVEWIECRGNVWYVWTNRNNVADADGNIGYLHRINWTDWPTRTFTATQIFALPSSWNTSNFPARGADVSADGTKVVFGVYAKNGSNAVPIWFSGDSGATVDLIYLFPGTTGVSHCHGCWFAWHDPAKAYCGFGDTTTKIAELTRPANWTASGSTDGTNQWTARILSDTLPSAPIKPANKNLQPLGGESACGSAWLNIHGDAIGYAPIVNATESTFQPYQSLDFMVSFLEAKWSGGVWYRSAKYYQELTSWQGGIYAYDEANYRICSAIFRQGQLTGDWGVDAMAAVWNGKLWGMAVTQAAGGNIMASWDIPATQTVSGLRLEKALANRLKTPEDSTFRTAAGAASAGSWAGTAAAYSCGVATVQVQPRGGLNGEECLAVSCARDTTANGGSGATLNYGYQTANNGWALTGPTSSSGVGTRVVIEGWVKPLNRQAAFRCTTLPQSNFRGAVQAETGTSAASPSNLDGYSGASGLTNAGPDNWTKVFGEAVFVAADDGNHGCRIEKVSFLADCTAEPLTFLLDCVSVHYDAGRYRLTDYVLPNNDGSGNPITRPSESASATLPAIAADWTLFTDWRPMAGWAEYLDRTIPTAAAPTITRTGSTATATSAHHCYVNGDSVTIAGAAQAEYNGTFTVTRLTDDTFSYAVGGTPATPATGTISASKVWPADDIGIWTLYSQSQRMYLRYDSTNSWFVLSDGTTAVHSSAVKFRHHDQIRFALSQSASTRTLFVYDYMGGAQSIDASVLAFGTPDTAKWGIDEQLSQSGCGCFYGFVLAHDSRTLAQVQAAWLQAGTSADAGLVDIGAGSYPTTPAYIADYPATSSVQNAVAYEGGALIGSYNPMAAAVFPLPTHVVTVETAYGPTGSEYTGSLNMALYTVLSGVVDPQWVATGHANYAGGENGTYPTTATAKATQFADDQAAVAASVGFIIAGHSILSQAGAYNLSADEAAQFAAGQLAQLTADRAAVAVASASILNTATLLTIAGAFDLTVAEATAYSAGQTDGAAAQLATDQAAVTAATASILNTATVLAIAGTFDLAAAEAASYDTGYAAGYIAGETPPPPYETTGTAGALSLPEENLRAMLADSTTFQALCRVRTSAGALGRIYRDGLPLPANGSEHAIEELQALRPHAIIFLGDRNGLTLDGGPAEGFSGAGRASIVLERDCPDTLGDEPTSEANRDWKNIVGQIMYELCALTCSAQPGYLMLHRVELALGPFWPKPEDAISQGLWQGAVLEVRWRGV